MDRCGVLTYLGLRTLFAPQSRMEGPQGSNGISAWAVYRQAILTNVLNPKVALFFIAFLPQFVDPTTSTRVLTFLFLGMCFIITGTLWCLILACASGFFKQSIDSRPRVRTIIEKLTGGLFVYLGAGLALDDR
jgi:threonine/homoserine/homoserine lactone efflux protein